jgi:hypothetical protein
VHVFDGGSRNMSELALLPFRILFWLHRIQIGALPSISSAFANSTSFTFREIFW